MLVFDTNVLIYAIDQDSPYHDRCRDYILQVCDEPSISYLSWSICYEFLRVVTHLRAPLNPLSSSEAWDFLKNLLASPRFDILTPTQRHMTVLAQTLKELPDVRGNLIHDLHVAVLMRENGISRICTRDTDFYRFPFLTVIDPLQSVK